ncbi:MAG: ABC transporter ATP-binding protein [Pseudomonadales bacterium]|nr:ABC transporter ATP-binding protein [Pseudomonadales bacterium]
MSLLSVKQLQYRTDTRCILSGVDCQLQAGEFVGLIGANGAGKTTLLRLLIGLLTPCAGDVLINGKSLQHYSRRALARRMTLVPQDTGIAYPFSVRELVAMGRHPHLRRFAPMMKDDLAIVESAMRTLAVDGMADKPVTALSGGERQRVMIARALAQQTAIVLLDEATASLDLCHQLDVLEAAKRLAQQGHLVIAAIHDLSMASRFCDRLLLLADGKLAACGSPQQVLTPAHLHQHFSVDAHVQPAYPVAGLHVTAVRSLIGR